MSRNWRQEIWEWCGLNAILFMIAAVFNVAIHAISCLPWFGGRGGDNFFRENLAISKYVFPSVFLLVYGFWGIMRARSVVRDAWTKWRRNVRFQKLFGLPIVQPGSAMYVYFVRQVDGIIQNAAHAFFHAVGNENSARKSVREYVHKDAGMYQCVDGLRPITEQKKKEFWALYDSAREAGVPVRWMVNWNVGPERQSPVALVGESVTKADWKEIGFRNAFSTVNSYRVETMRVEELYIGDTLQEVEAK